MVQMQEASLQELLVRFWNWAGITEWDYAKGHEAEPFHYPDFNKMRNMCIRLLRAGVYDTQLHDCLTCLALDNEEEFILDAMKDMGASSLEPYVAAGITHPQPHARWQIAELLHCCNIPGRGEYLHVLLQDECDYVVKRAGNAVEDLKKTGTIV